MPPENNLRPLTDIAGPNPPSLLKQIRTFQGDVAEALGRHHESLVSIQQTEQFKRRQDPSAIIDAENTKRRKTTLGFLLGTLLFLALGGVGAWYGYNLYLSKTAPPVLAVPGNRFIPAESTVNLDTTKSTRESLLASFGNALVGLPAGELRQVVLRGGSSADSPLTTTAEFMHILEAHAPGNLIRAVDPLFMLGSLGESHFLIFKLNSFNNAYSGMLAWEAGMNSDLAPLIAPGALVKSIGSASVFKDVIVRNKDVRALQIADASTTETVLLYTFLDSDMLIITDRIETLQTLMDRLTREKLSR